MYLELLRGCKSEESSSVQFINVGEKNILLNRELIVVVRKSSLEADQACGSDPVEARQSQHLLDDMQTLILLDQDSSDHHGNQAHDVVDKNASRSSLIAAAPERPLLSAVSWSHLPSGRTKNGSSAVVVSQLISIGGSAATAVTDPPRLNIDHSSFDSDESASEMQGNFEITIQRTNLGTAQEMIKVDHLISAAGAASHHQQLQELIPCADRQQICGDSDLTSEHHMTDPESSKSSTEEAPEEYEVVDHLQQRHAAHLTTSMSSGLNAAAAAATTTTTMMQQPQQPAEDDDDPILLLPSAQILMRIQPLATALAPADQTNLNFVEQSFFPSTPFLHRDDQNTDQDVEIGYTRPQNQRLPLLAEATSKAPGLTHVTSEPACTSGTVNSEATAEQQTRDIHEYRQQQHKLLLHDESTDDDDNNNSSSNKLMSRSACRRLHEYSSPAAGSLDHGNHERSWTLAPAATAGSKRRLPETGFNSGEPPHEWLQLSLRSSISAEAATAAAGATTAKTGYRTQIQSCSSDQAMKASVALTAAAVVTDQPSLDLSFGTRPVVSAAAAPVPVLNNTSCTSEGKNVNHSVSARASHYDQGLEAAAGSLLERLEICRAPAVARDHARVPSPSTDPNPSGSYKRLQTLGQTSRQISTSSSLSSTLMLMTTAAAVDPSCSGRPLMRGVGAAGGLDDYVQLMSSSSRRSLTTTTTTTTTHIYTRSPDPGSSTSCLQQQQPDQTSSLRLPFAEREFIGVPAAAACNNSLQSNPVSTSCPAWACTQAPAAAAPPPPRDFASCFHNKLNPNVEPPHQLQLSSAQFLEGLMPNTGTFPNSAGVFPNSSRIFANSTGIFPHTGFSSSQCSPLFERTSSVGNKFCKEIQFGVLQDHGSCPDLPRHVITAGGPKNYERPGAPPHQLPPPCPARGLGQSAMVHMPSSGGFPGAARLGLGWPSSSSNEISLSTNTTSENLGLVAVEAAAAAAEGNAIEKGSSSPDSLQKLLKSVAGPSVTICQPPTTLLQDVNHHFSFVKRGVLNPPSLHLSNNVSHISTKLTQQEKTILMI
jgi:hypothetical protein